MAMSIRSWVKVTGKLWTDTKFLDLSTDARLLFIWSWMPPHASVCGLYGASMKQLSRALGLSEHVASGEQIGRVLSALGELRERGMVLYDDENEVLWCVNRVKHAPQTPATVELMQQEVLACPESPLVDAFIARYGSLLGLS